MTETNAIAIIITISTVFNSILGSPWLKFTSIRATLRGGGTLWITTYMVSVQSQGIGRRSARPFFATLSFW